MQKQPAVYILSSMRNGTLYIGVTSNLLQRIWKHKNKQIKGFTAKYNITNLVYYEIFDDMENAIYKEKQLKKWKRDWKIRIIEEKNPNWDDLYETLTF